MSAKPKARVMWASYEEGQCPNLHRKKAHAHAWDWAGGKFVATQVVRVAVIPLIDLDELVVNAVGAYWTGENKRPDLTREEAMRLALTAAGIPCTKRRARK